MRHYERQGHQNSKCQGKAGKKQISILPVHLEKFVSKSTQKFLFPYVVFYSYLCLFSI